MKIVRTIDAVRASLTGEVGLVPTMGALHDGHRALFAAAREENELVVASLFVNPAQFGEAADLAAYPRDEAADARIAEECGVDILFAPSADELYPDGFRTWVDVDDTGAEGAARPGHFRGVATVCLKLFNIVRPRRAYFGQKDAQQAAVLRRLVRDLNVPVEIRVLPTVRDDDGLALSSRNAYLTDEERARASVLPIALRAGLRAHRAGLDPVAAALSVLNAASGIEIDYVDIGPWQPSTLVAAIRIGTTRLIDNVPLTSESVEP
jgi:pantoate--beta-alanine ligase